MPSIGRLFANSETRDGMDIRENQSDHRPMTALPVSAKAVIAMFVFPNALEGWLQIACWAGFHGSVVALAIGILLASTGAASVCWVIAWLVEKANPYAFQ